MEIVDMIVLGIVGMSSLLGIFRGLVKEALSLTAWITAVILASLFGDTLAVKMEDLIEGPIVRKIVAVVLIFISTVFVGGLIGNLISKATAAVGLKSVDCGLGAMFGIARGLIIVTIIVMMTAPLGIVTEEYNQSFSVPYILELGEFLQSKLGVTPPNPATLISA